MLPNGINDYYYYYYYYYFDVYFNSLEDGAVVATPIYYFNSQFQNHGFNAYCNPIKEVHSVTLSHTGITAKSIRLYLQRLSTTNLLK